MTDKNSSSSLSEHWQRVLAGDVDAFKFVVEQHQSVVSAVAYSILGDFATSQDVAQETFWVAWSSRNSLRDASRLGPWLCGIARNLARQTRRRLKRMKTNSDAALTTHASSVDGQDSPSVSEEDQQVVWSALEQIPEKYREAVTLFYRQGQSVADVALATGVSNDTARQRLSRGRSMLKGRVAQVIEGVMTGTAPDRQFASRVIAAITGIGVAAKTSGTAAASTISLKSASAAAGMAATAAKGVVGTGMVAGMLGGAAGSVGGLLGGWLGTWIPAQLAETETERQLLLERGRFVMRMTVLFTVAIFAVTLSMVFNWLNVVWFASILTAVCLAFVVSIISHTMRTQVLVRDLRLQLDPETSPNESALRKMMESRFGKKKMADRCWTSTACFLGLPLVDIQLSAWNYANPGYGNQRKIARGWIAIGDSAHGILLGVGGIARGIVAFGGLSMGLISFGGLAVGVLSLGGATIGAIAIGGAAIGWDALGGAAAGWHSAAGGAAVAWHIAVGGGALAHDFAVGGRAYAAEVNTPLAMEVMETQSLFWMMEWIRLNSRIVLIGSIVISVVPSLFFAWVWRKTEPAVE